MVLRRSSLQAAPDCSYWPFMGGAVRPRGIPQLKELKIPGDHEILEVWEDNIAFKVHAILDENNVDWSSTEIVRIDNVGEPSGNIILWIGVWRRDPGGGSTPLSYDGAVDVALKCKKLLVNYGFVDIDVELRESDIIQSVGPQLLEPTDDLEPLQPSASLSPLRSVLLFVPSSRPGPKEQVASFSKSTTPTARRTFS